MRIQFLHDGSDLRSYGGGSFAKNRGNGGLFWWTIFIFLLIALATATWFFCIMVFNYPEKPFSYRFLSKINKLEALKSYDLNSVPKSKFLSPTKLLEEYTFFTPERMRVTNDQLKRDYIRNFRDHGPVYVRGTFTVTATRRLTGDDVFTDGWVAVVRANELEDVSVELVLPGLSREDSPYRAGDQITLDGKKGCAAAVHLQKQENDRLLVTAVPLLYGTITTFEGSLASLKAPEKLNMDAVWPIWRDAPDAKVEAGQASEAVVKAVQVTAAPPVR